jgi:hypothetical protein
MDTPPMTGIRASATSAIPFIAAGQFDGASGKIGVMGVLPRPNGVSNCSAGENRRSCSLSWRGITAPMLGIGSRRSLQSDVAQVKNDAMTCAHERLPQAVTVVRPKPADYTNGRRLRGRLYFNP